MLSQFNDPLGVLHLKLSFSFHPFYIFQNVSDGSCNTFKSTFFGWKTKGWHKITMGKNCLLVFFPCISWWWNSWQAWGNKTNKLSRQQISTKSIELTLNVRSHHLSLVQYIHCVTCRQIVPLSPVKSAVWCFFICLRGGYTVHFCIWQTL